MILEEKYIEIAQKRWFENVDDVPYDTLHISNTVESNMIIISDFYVKLEAENENIEDNTIALCGDNCDREYF